MSFELIAGIGIVLFVLSYLFIKLGEKEQSHMVLQLFLLGFIVGGFLILGKAGIDANCEIKLNDTRETYKYGDNFTDYHWDQYIVGDEPTFHPNDDVAFIFHRYVDYNYVEVCEDDNTETIFYRFLVWISRIIVAYIIVYYIYEVLKYFSLIGGGSKE